MRGLNYLPDSMGAFNANKQYSSTFLFPTLHEGSVFPFTARAAMTIHHYRHYRVTEIVQRSINCMLMYRHAYTSHNSYLDQLQLLSLLRNVA